MNKILNTTWKVTLLIIIAFSLIGAGLLYSKRDELVTSHITMDYFEKVVNKNDETMIKGFVANSKNDILQSNFITALNNNYYYEGVSDFEFKVVNQEVFGNGKYQCYFATSFENYVTKCDLENEGRYMNYLIDIEVSYKLNGEAFIQKEKGLVVFVKDMEKGNYFTWKLVRFDWYFFFHLYCIFFGQHLPQQEQNMHQ